MGVEFDPDTIERLRALDPRRAYAEVRDAVFRSGAVSSDDFLEAFERLVEEGVFTWDQVELFGEAESGPLR